MSSITPNLTNLGIGFLGQRQRLLRDLLDLSKRAAPSAASAAIAASRFCDQLIDYLSHGHFRVFHICQGTSPRRQAEVQRAAIETTTDAAMAFADLYGNLGRFNWQKLREDLSTLALTLATRFDLEDELLQQLDANNPAAQELGQA